MHYVWNSWVLMIVHSIFSDFFDKTLLCKLEKHSHLAVSTKGKKIRNALKVIMESQYMTYDFFFLVDVNS